MAVGRELVKWVAAQATALKVDIALVAKTVGVRTLIGSLKAVHYKVWFLQVVN